MEEQTSECDRGREQRKDSRVDSLFTRIKDPRQSISLLEFLFPLRSLPDASVPRDAGLTFLHALVVYKRPQLLQAFVLLGYWSRLVDQLVGGENPYQDQTAEDLALSLGLLETRDAIRECQKWEESLTPVLKAARSGSLQKVKDLIATEAQVIDDCDAMNYSLDFWAMTGGNLDLIKYVIVNGGLMKMDRQGRNILHLAVYAPTEALDVVLDAAKQDGLKNLIDARDVYSERDQCRVFYRKAPIGEHLCVDWEVYRVDRNLLDRFKTCQTPDSVQPFATMKFQGRSDELDEKALDEFEKLRNWIDRSKPDRTPLHYSVSVGNYEMSRELLSLGATVDEKDGCGMTALHVAAMNGDVKLVELLLRHNASKNELDHTGATAEQVAKENLHPDVAAELLSTPTTLQMACCRRPVSTEITNDITASSTDNRERQSHAAARHESPSSV